MSPEQAAAKPLDARSDVFSFGAVLYELLAGTRAFTGDSTAQVLSAVLRDDPGPFEAPPVLQQIVKRCLAKDPDRRFQTMADVRHALQHLTEESADVAASIAVLPFANLSADRENEYLRRWSRRRDHQCAGAGGWTEGHCPHVGVLVQGEGTKTFATSRRRSALPTCSKGACTWRGPNPRDGPADCSCRWRHSWSERYDRPMTDVFRCRTISPGRSRRPSRAGSVSLPPARGSTSRVSTPTKATCPGARISTS